MNPEQSGNPNLADLMAMLRHKDGLVRKKGREGLQALGKPAVAPLCQVLLTEKDHHVRWAAAKALGELRDPDSAPALVDALEDRNADVAWLAAVALENLGRDAWKPLLQALVDRGADSVAIRQGAHHVLSRQKAPGFDDLLDQLRAALKFGELTESGGIAATELLKRVRALEAQSIREWVNSPGDVG